MERNTCPYHANARRLLRCLHSNKIAKEIAVSCRQMCAISMCKHDDVMIDDPLTWRIECVNGTCEKCLNPVIKIPKEMCNINVTYSNWMYGKKVQAVTKKKQSEKHNEKTKKKDGIQVYSLFPVTATLKEVTT